MMRMTNIHTVSVRASQGSHQALNLPVEQLSEAVRPWFGDWMDARIARAIDELAEPTMRHRAAAFLGLELIPAA